MRARLRAVLAMIAFVWLALSGQAHAICSSCGGPSQWYGFFFEWGGNSNLSYPADDYMFLNLGTNPATGTRVVDVYGNIKINDTVFDPDVLIPTQAPAGFANNNVYTSNGVPYFNSVDFTVTGNDGQTYYVLVDPFPGSLGTIDICSSPSGCTVGQGNIYSADDITITAETPLPAALPLFAGGLGALGLFGWRRKRKAAAA